VTTSGLDANAENLLRELAPQVLGSTLRRFKDFAAAEDAVQEALIAASVQWPQEGIPENPRGWLIHVATRRMTDFLRSETARRNREELAGQPSLVDPWSKFRETGTLERDDTLVLLFMCIFVGSSSRNVGCVAAHDVDALRTEELTTPTEKCRTPCIPVSSCPRVMTSPYFS